MDGPNQDCLIAEQGAVVGYSRSSWRHVAEQSKLWQNPGDYFPSEGEGHQ